MTNAERISLAVERGIAARDPQRHLEQLTVDKERLLKRGYLIMLGRHDEERARWLNEYNAICRLIHENENELRSMAA
jgi:hypothetical protein